MKKKQTRIDYEERILRVVTYIHDHIDEDLSTEKLAQIACFSPYHWHRIYRAMTGETAYQTIRRVRLARAASALVRTNSAVEQIAKEAGYSSVEAFHRAFVKNYNHPPASYRKRKTACGGSSQSGKENGQMSHIEIRETEPLKLATLLHKGPYEQIGKSFETLYIWASARHILNDKTRAMAVYFHDPRSMAPEDLRALAAIVVDKDFVPDDDRVDLYDLPGGRVAVALHKGPYSELENTYDQLFSTWLPESGEQPVDEPLYEEYLNNPRTTPPHELLTEICIRLKS